MASRAGCAPPQEEDHNVCEQRAAPALKSTWADRAVAAAGCNDDDGGDGPAGVADDGDPGTADEWSLEVRGSGRFEPQDLSVAEPASGPTPLCRKASAPRDHTFLFSRPGFAGDGCCRRSCDFAAVAWESRDCPRNGHPPS